MRDWHEIPLNSLVSFQKGRKVDTSPFQREGFLRYLGASGLAGGDDGYANEQFAVIAKCTDTLMLWDGERSGLVGYGQDGVVASTVSKLSPGSSVHPKYLYFALASHFDWIQHRRTGTGVPHVPKDLGRILKLRIPHSLRVQERIANVLSCIDTAIEKTEALIAKHQQIKAGLMHDLFTRGVLPNGQLRPPRSEAPELYQETALGWIPQDWSLSDCGREFAIDSGITLGPHRRPGRNARPYLRVANVHRDELRLEDLAYLEELAGDADLPLKEKDLLVVEGHANRMEIGRCAMVTEAAVGMLFQNHLFRLRPQRLVSEFALDWLNSHHAQRYWDMTCSTSSGLNTINRKMLGRLPVLVPPADEQARIVRAVAVMKCRIEEEAQLLNKLRKQKLGLMQDLLTGRVPVPAAPEPAEATA